MIQLVTVQEVKEQLRIDGTADDAWLDVTLPAVTQAVVNWCGGEERVTDDAGNPLEPARLAVLVEMSFQDRNRGGMAEDMQDWYSVGYMLNRSSTAILTPLRKPVAQ